jgi:hypothetical protein
MSIPPGRAYYQLQSLCGVFSAAGAGRGQFPGTKDC